MPTNNIFKKDEGRTWELLFSDQTSVIRFPWRHFQNPILKKKLTVILTTEVILLGFFHHKAQVLRTVHQNYIVHPTINQKDIELKKNKIKTATSKISLPSPCLSMLSQSDETPKRVTCLKYNCDRFGITTNAKFAALKYTIKSKQSQIWMTAAKVCQCKYLQTWTVIKHSTSGD